MVLAQSSGRLSIGQWPLIWLAWGLCEERQRRPPLEIASLSLAMTAKRFSDAIAQIHCRFPIDRFPIDQELQTILGHENAGGQQ